MIEVSWHSSHHIREKIGAMNFIRNKLKSLKTLPNKLTVGRILVIPVLLVLFPLTYELVYLRWFCAFLFFIAAVTDFFDGYIARKFNHVSKVGALLDPIAHKILTTCAVILLVGAGYLPAFLGGLLLCREVAVSGMRMAALELNFAIEVSSLGKYKTVVLNFAFFCLMVHSDRLEPIGMGSIWIGLLLSYYSAYEYGKGFWKKGKFSFVEISEGSDRSEMDGGSTPSS